VTPSELDEALTAAHGFSAAVCEHWSAAVDAAMGERLGGLPAAATHQRIRTAVLTRFDLLTPHKQMARRAAVFLALPQNAPLALRLLARTSDAIWRAAGDTATDFNWYSKRAVLAGVYAATEVAWFGDDTPGASRTAKFLDARLGEVVQYEKLKARMRAALTPIRTHEGQNG
jgi:ubiquinone biosynthesis protein COQ9